MKSFRRRTRLFIARRLQIRFVSIILLVMFSTALISGYVVYVTTASMFGEKLAVVYPQGLLMEIAKKVNFVLIVRLLIMTPVVVFIALFLSNRIAGPLYRIDRFLRKAAGGNYNIEMELRKGDELHDLSERLNRLVARLRAQKEKRLKITSSIMEELAKLEGEASSLKDNKRIASLISEIRRETEKIK